MIHSLLAISKTDKNLIGTNLFFFLRFIEIEEAFSLITSPKKKHSFVQYCFPICFGSLWNSFPYYFDKKSIAIVIPEYIIIINRCIYHSQSQSPIVVWKMKAPEKKPLVRPEKPEEVRAKVRKGSQKKVQNPIHALSEFQSPNDTV